MQIIETIDVDVPVATAYNQWTQFESFPHFLDEVESITQLDDTHVRWKVKVGGSSASSTPRSRSSTPMSESRGAASVATPSTRAW